ncbi:hypothetical protein [Paenibacillus xylaniclasticus]|uniref:hypothetical protein n=1 Tax=Paenibacillus xylaniclasticus TaxID=588083 RepID=UPI000FD8BB12|nr:MULTISPECIES: hypothetical protein [Paenibacillus]GFN32603.1 hypothetical protein PCURB6_28630 [Paenibacillus curdlanolyticus]
MITITNKKLSITSIEKQHAKTFNKKQKHILSNGDYIIIETKFKKTSIIDFITDFFEVVQQMIKRNVDMNIMKDITFVQLMLYLKHFTNLDNIPVDFEKMVIICRKLIDLNLIDEIINLFDKNELDKVNAMLKEASNNKEYTKQIEELFALGYLNELRKGSNESSDNKGEVVEDNA